MHENDEYDLQKPCCHTKLIEKISISPEHATLDANIYPLLFLVKFTYKKYISELKLFKGDDYHLAYQPFFDSKDERFLSAMSSKFAQDDDFALLFVLIYMLCEVQV